MDIHQLADEVRRRRLARGWSVEEAARRAGINRVTYKRIEDALSVQDVKRRAVETVFDIGERPPQLTRGAGGHGGDVARLVAPDLNPDLTAFTDHELLRELEQRMLLLAGQLQEAAGADLLSVTVGETGERHIVSHTTKTAR
jgi:transcriptional regulator with XRE-family HTH domain